MAEERPEADRDDRLNEILLAYVEAVERGEAPDLKPVLDAHPEHAARLTAFFATRDRLDRVAAPLRAIAGADSRRARDPDLGATGFAPPPAPGRPAPGAEIGRVGDFRLIREVGRGGMGVVYEAEQVSLRRRVALKVLPFAAAIDPRHLQRFRNEAQAAAQLHHTHIVPVFAVGAEGGVHFYAMQFIDGQSLAQLLADLRRAGGRSRSAHSPGGPPGSSEVHLEPTGAADRTARGPQPTGAIPSAAISAERAARRRDYFRRVADLIRQAADALEYAHQVGVVHRDIKPANLLLDATGRLWVADFGLAQIRNDVGLTATGELVGTVRYMSPEQALGTPGLVDHRSDIYSLGASLYELLTLSPVFTGEDSRGVLHRLAEEEPSAPRTLDRAIPAELETIVLKAIAKGPADRYASAQEFAADLQRFLNDRPILARRPTLADRATKWVRRHRGTALAAVLVLLLVSAGLAVSTAVIVREHAGTKAALGRERDANERERERAREAAEQRAAAEDNYLRTRRAVDLFVELSDEEALDFPPLAPLRQRLLEAAVAYYQELSDRREDAALRKGLDASLVRLARLREELDAFNEVNTVLLLDQPAVQTELKLTPDQVGRLAPVLDRLWAQLRAPVPGQKNGPRRQVADLVAALRREVGAVVTAAQDRRLRELFFQLPGPHVFGTALLDALGLTDQQKREVRRIHTEAMHASMRPPDDSREDRYDRFDEAWREANARIVALLTPPQRARLAEMTGAPAPSGIHLPRPSAQARK
ncbi:serine/threonine-protein kinase [Frigoriglobus tundricola]|uniref:non-specific serine/threonine protein kinase n=1 Tax=Frigoriglobus tundricola TaxID=2774151 RepID=A0A6M5YN45_9BACT|nr:serine/threonine-protein kinase [Frigoriglobus tundricola]QJW94790.1 hypothetical protein FTUN_2313 [Frigoriglobus tundricola]